MRTATGGAEAPRGAENALAGGGIDGELLPPTGSGMPKAPNGGPPATRGVPAPPPGVLPPRCQLLLWGNTDPLQLSGPAPLSGTKGGGTPGEPRLGAGIAGVGRLGVWRPGGLGSPRGGARPPWLAPGTEEGEDGGPSTGGTTSTKRPGVCSREDGNGVPLRTELFPTDCCRITMRGGCRCLMTSNRDRATSCSDAGS